MGGSCCMRAIDDVVTPRCLQQASIACCGRQSIRGYVMQTATMGYTWTSISAASTATATVAAAASAQLPPLYLSTRPSWNVQCYIVQVKTNRPARATVTSDSLCHTCIYGPIRRYRHEVFHRSVQVLAHFKPPSWATPRTCEGASRPTNSIDSQKWFFAEKCHSGTWAEIRRKVSIHSLFSPAP